MLTVQALRKSFRTDEGVIPVLDGVDLALERGETLSLTGESGSGKSTLLHLVAALDRADSGSIHLDGVALGSLNEEGLARLRATQIGLIFQQFNLIPSLNVADNIAFQARLAGRHDPGWVKSLSEGLGLAGLENRFPEQLSGGQQQRVAIGRALAHRPPLILADEPTGSLDEVTGETVIGLLTDLVARTGAALLMVTHSQTLARRLDRRLVLSHGRLARPMEKVA